MNQTPLPVTRAQLLDQLIETASPFVLSLEHVRAPQDHAQRIAVSLACTVIEIFTAVTVVLRSEAANQALTLVRSMLDAYGDLRCITGDPAYILAMELDAGTNLLAVYEGFMADPAIRPSMTEEHRETIRQAKRKVAELKAQGIELLRPKAKFEKAGIGTLYTSFQHLCSSTHNDLNSLTARHLRPEGLIVDEMPAETLHGVCVILLVTLVNALRALTSITELTEEQLDRLVEEHTPKWQATLEAFASQP